VASAMRALLGLGQSIWLDYLRRGMTRSGELGRMVDDGLRGLTSNPTIFEEAITRTTEASRSSRPHSISCWWRSSRSGNTFRRRR
jgi:hypothetical protein